MILIRRNHRHAINLVKFYRSIKLVSRRTRGPRFEAVSSGPLYGNQICYYRFALNRRTHYDNSLRI